MRKCISFIVSAAVCFPAFSLEYRMIKGDTLWSLSEAYLKDPYLWPQITYVDGTKVTEPRRMPIGTLLLIKKEIASPRALVELVEETPKTTPTLDVKSSSVFVVNPSIQKMLASLDDKQKNRLWDYYLTSKEGLVRAFYNGQEVVIDVQIIIEQLRYLEGKNK